MQLITVSEVSSYTKEIWGRFGEAADSTRVFRTLEVAICFFRINRILNFLVNNKSDEV